MSVPESKRTEGELKVITKGRALIVRTLAVCSNEKYFPKRLRWCYTQQIVTEASGMFSLINKANSVFVKSEEDARLRIRYWREALACATALYAFVDLSHDTAHVELEKVRSWCMEVHEVQTLIRGRINAELRKSQNG